MQEDLRRKELAEFLKSRRKRLSPQETGLTENGGRRRTSGLRREEGCTGRHEEVEQKKAANRQLKSNSTIVLSEFFFKQSTPTLVNFHADIRLKQHNDLHNLLALCSPRFFHRGS
jgi:hypothetical protein